MKLPVILSGLLAIASFGAWRSAIPAPVAEPRELGPGAQPLPPPDTVALAAAAARIRARNAFRLDRKPTDVLYNPWESSSAPTPPPPPPQARPTLVLTGLVGPPWNALIDGVPGYETGVLLTLGEERHGITFAVLRGDTVVLSGLDTTWTLTARRAWR